MTVLLLYKRVEYFLFDLQVVIDGLYVTLHSVVLLLLMDSVRLLCTDSGHQLSMTSVTVPTAGLLLRLEPDERVGHYLYVYC